MCATKRNRTQAGDAHRLGQQQVQPRLTVHFAQIRSAPIAEFDACFFQFRHLAGLDQNIAVFTYNGGGADGAAQRALDARGTGDGERLEPLNSRERVLPIGAVLLRQRQARRAARHGHHRQTEPALLRLRYHYPLYQNHP